MKIILLLFGLVCLIGVPYSVLVPIIASGLLHGGPHTFGFLMGAVGVGAFVSGIRLAARRSADDLGKLVAVSAGLFGVGLIGLSQSRTVWLLLTLMGVMGLGMMQQFTASNTVVQTLAPEAKRGRVLSYWTMTYMGAVPAGSLIVGAMAQTLGVSKTAVLCGLGCLVGAAWFEKSRRSMKHQAV